MSVNQTSCSNERGLGVLRARCVYGGLCPQITGWHPQGRLREQFTAAPEAQTKLHGCSAQSSFPLFSGLPESRAAEITQPECDLPMSAPVPTPPHPTHLPVPELLFLIPVVPPTSYLNDSLSAFPKPMVLKVWSPENLRTCWTHTGPQAPPQTY